MQANDLTLTFVGVTLLYPPLSRFRGNELPDFYSTVCKRHQFDKFALIGEGALLETESERRLLVERESLAYEEHVRGATNPFPVVKQRTTDLVSDSAEHFGMRVFLPQDCTVRSLWSVPEELGEADTVLRDNAFSIREDQFEHLGGVSGVGMHLLGHKDDEEEDFGWSLEIAPYLPEDGFLFIEVSSHMHSPLTKAEEVGEFLQTTYDFLTDNVVAFINAFL